MDVAESMDFSGPVEEHGSTTDTAGSECESDGERAVSVEEVLHTPFPERSSKSTASPSDRDEGIGIDQTHPTPPTSSAPASFYSFRSRKKSMLVYDAKYHPMDDAIRPTQAAKRRSAHGEKQVCCDSDESSEASAVVHTDAEDSEDEHSETEAKPKKASRCKKRKLTQSRLHSVEPTRRSSRSVSKPKVSYDMAVHPQDDFLVVSSDEEEPVSKKKPKTCKHKRPEGKPASDKRAAASEPEHRKHVDYVDNSTGDEREFHANVVRSSVGPDTDSSSHAEGLPSSPAATNVQNGILTEETMDHCPLSSRNACLHHNKNTWPTASGQSFSIFTEQLSDQLARDTQAALPLNYEHDDKENMSDNNPTDMDPLPTAYTGVSIIPEAQYRQSSEDRELSAHRALVSDALYGDPFPQTYGLDGAHYHAQGETDVFFESMSILASGAHLPLKKNPK